MASNGKIGVVTVTYGSASVLPDFLRSTLRQSLEDFILYVVDNDSKDDSAEIASSSGDTRIQVIRNHRNVGVAEGNNQGIRAALGDGCRAVLLLNNDTVFGSDLFGQLSDGLREYRCSITTPKICYYDRPEKIWAAGGYFQPRFAFRAQHYGEGEIDDGRFDDVRAVTYAPTCCVLIDKEVFDRIGFMDPSYFVYVDDVDFMFRAMRAGLTTMYLPGCKLLHKVSSLTGHMSNFMVRYSTRNRIYFLRKHLPLRQAAFWYALYRGYYTVEFAAGRTSRERWNLRQSAAQEGWQMGASSGRLNSCPG